MEEENDYIEKSWLPLDKNIIHQKNQYKNLQFSCLLRPFFSKFLTIRSSKNLFRASIDFFHFDLFCTRASSSAAQIYDSDQAFFYFCIFQKKNYRNIFLVSGFTILSPYRPAGRRWDLYVNKNKFILHRGPWREPAAPCRPTGGRQAPSKDLCTK